jgi:hypothetical protein
MALARAAGASTSLDRVISARLSHLGDGYREYLELAAVAAQPLDEGALAQALSLPRTDILTIRRHLIMECFIRHADRVVGAVEPYHDKVREGVLHSLAPSKLRAHHSRLARALEGTATGEPEILALHFREGGDVTMALHYTERAANEAARALAFDRAARLYEAAAELAGSGPDALRLGRQRAEALSNAGHATVAADVFLALSARTPSDLELRLRAGDELLHAGKIDRGLEILRAVAQAIGQPFPMSDVVAILAVLWNGLCLRHLRVSHTTPRLAAPIEQHQLALCFSIATQLSMVDTLRSVLYQRRYLRLAARLHSEEHIATGLAIEASVSTHMSPKMGGGVARAKILLAQCADLVSRTRSPRARANLHFAEGQVAYAQGRWGECRRALELALETVRTEVGVRVRWEIALCQSFIAFMLWMEGNVPELRVRIGEYMAEARTIDALETITTLRIATMRALCDDDSARARRLTEATMRKWPERPWRLQNYFAGVATFEVDLYEGRGESAWERMKTWWRRTRASGLFTQEFFVASSLAQRARIALHTGRLRRAERDIIALEARPERWAAALGAMLRAALAWARGRAGEACAVLDDAVEALSACELGLYADAARARLGVLRREAETTESALASLRRRGVAEPRRMVGSLLPWTVPEHTVAEEVSCNASTNANRG